MEEDGPSDKQDDGANDSKGEEPREAVETEKDAKEIEKSKKPNEKIKDCLSTLEIKLQIESVFLQALTSIYPMPTLDQYR